MIINSDWHIHSEYSYDASNSLEHIAEAAIAQGLSRIGITDHLNFNDEKFKGDIYASANAVHNTQKTYSNIVLGVELTPIERPEFDYIATCGKREGYIPPFQSTPYELEPNLNLCPLEFATPSERNIGDWTFRMQNHCNPT